MTQTERNEKLAKVRERHARNARMGKELVANNPLPDGLTNSQRNTMTRILLTLPEFDFYGEDYELKQMRIEVPKHEHRFDNRAFVVLETGAIGDEGTLAECLCRKHRVFWIGARGGVSILNSKCNTVSVSVFELLNKCYEN